MKKFILVSLILIVVALVATVVVWYLLQGMLSGGSSGKNTNNVMSDSSQEAISDQSLESQTEASSTESGEPISIGDFTVTEQQQQAAKSVGIDLEGLAITDAVIDCAQDALSPERIEEILAGAAPTFMETITLIPCLKK